MRPGYKHHALWTHQETNVLATALGRNLSFSHWLLKDNFLLQIINLVINLQKKVETAERDGRGPGKSACQGVRIMWNQKMMSLQRPGWHGFRKATNDALRRAQHHWEPWQLPCGQGWWQPHSWSSGHRLAAEIVPYPNSSSRGQRAAPTHWWLERPLLPAKRPWPSKDSRDDLIEPVRY